MYEMWAVSMLRSRARLATLLTMLESVLLRYKPASENTAGRRAEFAAFTAVNSG
jgi:hypothetical protein